MLIDDDLFDTVQTSLAVGFLAIATIAVIAAFWKKRHLFAAYGGIAFLLSVASIMLPEFLATVVFVAKGTPEPRISRARLIGTRAYVFANGSRQDLSMKPDSWALVVNDTDKTLQIEPIVYSVSGGSGTTEKPVPIAPFSSTGTPLWIQYYGRDSHQPPSTVKSEGYGETRYWLTWE